MPDQPSPAPRSVAEVQADLAQVADLLRGTDHLDPEARASLSALVDELRRTLDPRRPTTPQDAHLAATVAQLAEALRQQRPPGVLAAARGALEDAVMRADAEAPVATGIVRRLLEALSDLGI